MKNEKKENRTDERNNLVLVLLDGVYSNKIDLIEFSKPLSEFIKSVKSRYFEEDVIMQ